MGIAECLIEKGFSIEQLMEWKNNRKISLNAVNKLLESGVGFQILQDLINLNFDLFFLQYLNDRKVSFENLANLVAYGLSPDWLERVLINNAAILPEILEVKKDIPADRLKALVEKINLLDTGYALKIVLDLISYGFDPDWLKEVMSLDNNCFHSLLTLSEYYVEPIDVCTLVTKGISLSVIEGLAKQGAHLNAFRELLDFGIASEALLDAVNRGIDLTAFLDGLTKLLAFGIASEVLLDAVNRGIDLTAFRLSFLQALKSRGISLPVLGYLISRNTDLDVFIKLLDFGITPEVLLDAVERNIDLIFPRFFLQSLVDNGISLDELKSRKSPYWTDLTRFINLDFKIVSKLRDLKHRNIPFNLLQELGVYDFNEIVFKKLQVGYGIAPSLLFEAIKKGVVLEKVLYKMEQYELYQRQALKIQYLWQLMILGSKELTPIIDSFQQNVPWTLNKMKRIGNLYNDALDVDEHGNSIAHYAAWCGNRRLLHYITQYFFPETIYRCNRFHQSIVHFAAWSGEIKMFNCVIKSMPFPPFKDFCSVNAFFKFKDHNGRRPVHFAVDSGNPSLLRLFREYDKTTTRLESEKTAKLEIDLKKPKIKRNKILFFSRDSLMGAVTKQVPTVMHNTA